MKHHITYKNILGIILSGILVFTAGKLASQTYSSTIPTANKNYVRTTQVLVGNVNNDTQLNTTESKYLQQQIEYFDGLGRTQQQIAVGASPLKRDIITPVYYDALGRPTRAYLPYTIVNTPGGYRTAGLTSEQTTFYTGQFNASEAARAFSETVYEPSPLNRVIEQAMPGVGYQPGGGHTLRTDYGVNTASQVWMLTVNGNDLKVSGYYPAGKLRMTRTTDADNRISEEFTDFQGKVVLSQVKKDNSNYASTYYVYDDMGWLRWVVTPEGAKSLTNNQTVTFTSDFAKTYCYAYRYNTKGLICEKRIPGAESIYFVYDKGDRVAASQDGVQRPLKEWTVTKYDALGRPTETGLWTTTTVFTPEALQTQYNSNNNYFGTLAANNVLQKWYYDNYDQIALVNTTLKEQVIPDVVAAGDIRRELTRGLLTAQTIRLVNPNSSAITFYTTVFYYDQWGRIAQTIAQNHLGGTDITATKYLYPHSDLPELVYESHKYHAGNSVYPTLATTTRYTYDHAGRTTKLEQKIDNGLYTTLAEYVYDELGQLQNKYLAGKTTPVETQTFAYNIRGNLLSMNNPATVTNAKFGFRLGYNIPTLPGTIAQWGGNIVEMEWKSHTFAKQGYRFTYNNLNWLTAAVHLANATTPDNKFDEKGLTYDRNGNLLSLQRTNSAAVMVDNLGYTYANGRLSKVTEAVTGTPAGDVFGPTGASDYTYDVMGRLLTDSKRQITFTYYRETGMPKTVNIGSNQIKYWYDGAGKKLQSDYNSSNSVDYLGSMVFTTANSSRTPEGIAHAEGRTMRIGNAWVQQYHLKDHLGNVRVIVDQNKVVKETNDYYAFGSRWVDASSIVASPENRYKYNGKELQSWGNLGYYDYGARFYNPAVGRFSSIDPLAEKYYNINPSVYVANNPLKYIDPTGMFIDKPSPLEFVLPENPNDIDLKQWEKYTPANVNTIEKGHKLYWRHRETGIFLAWDDTQYYPSGFKKEDPHYHLYNNSKFKTRIDGNGILSGTKIDGKVLKKGDQRFHHEPGSKLNLSAISRQLGNTLNSLSLIAVMPDIFRIATKHPDALFSGFYPGGELNRAYGVNLGDNPLQNTYYEITSRSEDNSTLNVSFFNNYYYDYNYGHYRGMDQYYNTTYKQNENGEYEQNKFY